MVELVDVSVEFRRKNRWGAQQGSVLALDRVSLRIDAGERVGLTGPSGSGKSTLARCMAGWNVPSHGEVRRSCEVQLVMQDPGASLNPRFPAVEAIEEPLRIRGVAGHPGAELLERVGIEGARGGDRIDRFSGGQRARIAVARAMAARPDMLILDESLSALDDETRRQILLLLEEWRAAEGLSFVVVGHDVELLRSCTDRMLRMEGGRLVALDA